MAQSTEAEIIRAEIQELRNKVYDLENIIAKHEEAFEWIELAKKFVQKGVVAALVAKAEMKKEESKKFNNRRR